MLDFEARTGWEPDTNVRHNERSVVDDMGLAKWCLVTCQILTGSARVDPPALTGSAAAASSTAQGNGAPPSRMGGSFANVLAVVGLFVGLTLQS